MLFRLVSWPKTDLKLCARVVAKLPNPKFESDCISNGGNLFFLFKCFQMYWLAVFVPLRFGKRMSFYLSRFLNLLAKKTFFRWNKVSSLPKAVELEPIIVLLSIVIRFNQKPKDRNLAKEKNPATTSPPLLDKFFKEKNPLCIEVCMAVANFSLFAQISNKTTFYGWTSFYSHFIFILQTTI